MPGFQTKEPGSSQTVGCWRQGRVCLESINTGGGESSAVGREKSNREHRMQGERAGRYPMVHADLSTTGKLQPRNGLQSAPPRHADLLIFVASAIQLATVTSGTSPDRDISVPSPPLLPLPTFFSLFSSGLSCLHLMLIRPQVT